MSLSGSIDSWWRGKLEAYGNTHTLKKAYQKKPQEVRERIETLVDLISNRKSELNPKEITSFISAALAIIPRFQTLAHSFFKKACQEKELEYVKPFIHKLSSENYETAVRNLPEFLSFLPIDNRFFSSEITFTRLCEISAVEKATAWINRYPDIAKSDSFPLAIFHLFEKGNGETAFHLLRKFPQQKNFYQDLFDRGVKIGIWKLLEFCIENGALITPKSIINAAAGDFQTFFNLANLVPSSEILFFVDHNLKTPLTVACSQGNKEIAFYLFSLLNWEPLSLHNKAVILFSALEGKSLEICNYVLRLIDALEEEKKVIILNWPRLTDGKTPLLLALEIDETFSLSLFHMIQEVGGIQHTGSGIREIIDRAIERNFINFIEHIYPSLNPSRSIKKTFALNAYFTSKLFSCLKKGLEDIAFAFLKIGFVNCDVQDKEKKTVLHLAASYGNKNFFINCLQEIPFYPIKTLLQVRDIKGNNVLATACQNGQREIVEMLLPYGYDPNFRNASDETFFHLAAQSGMNVLLENIESTESINQYGGVFRTTPIVYALIHQQWESALCLLQKGAYSPSFSTPAVQEALQALRKCKDPLLLNFIFGQLSHEMESSCIPPQCDLFWLANREQGFFQRITLKDKKIKKEIVIHPTLLKSRSELFEDLFNGLWKGNPFPELIVDNIDDFYELLNLIYSGNAYEIPFGAFKPLAKLIPQYKLKGFDGYLNKWLEERPDCAHWKSLL